jgi:uncharacterized membrane protein
MNRPTQQQLDEFRLRLESLTAEFEELQRQASATEGWDLGVAETAPEPVQLVEPERPYEVPAWLEHVDGLFRAGQHRKAMRMVDDLRAAALYDSSTDHLAELLAYLQRVWTPRQDQLDRLRFTVQRSLEFAGARKPAEQRPAPTQQSAAQPAPAMQPPRPLLPAPRRATRPRREVKPVDLLGPRALAIAGGIVTLLGIVFFFVLAVNRGWIGQTGRVGLGAAAAALVYVGGLELRRRYGTTHSALAAVGAGIAGGYATLLFATALYHMLPNSGALPVAAGIATVGLVTALRWRSQIVAGLGLLGAMLAPVAIISHGQLSVLGTAFAGIVFAATAIVSIWIGWRELLVAGGIASIVQLLALVAEDKYKFNGPASVLAVAAFFAVLYAGSGVARQLRLKAASLDALATIFTSAGALVAVDAGARLFATSEQRGFAFLAVSVVYALAGTYFFVRPASRDLSAFLLFVAFTLGAVSLAELLNGQPLAYAWAAEAAGLARLARRVRDIRFQAWSAVYLVLAGIHVLAIDDKPKRLLELNAHPASGAGTAVAVAAAATVFSFYAGPWKEDVWSGRLFADYLARLAALGPKLRRAAAWIALAFAVYALSLGIVAVIPSFAWATVTLAGIWSAIGIAILAGGIRRDAAHLRAGALVWLLLTGLLAVEQALRVLDSTPRSWAFAIVGVASLIVSVGYSLEAWSSSLEQPDAIAFGSMLAALALFTYPIGSFLTGREQGSALLGVAALYAAVSTLLFRRSSRDFSTLYWIVAAGLAAVADVDLLNGTYSVLGWAAAGVAVALLARRIGEPRLHLGASAFLTLAVGRALIVQAPPTHMFHAQAHPAYGSASIFIAAAGVALAGRLALPELGRLRGYGSLPWWIAGVLPVYGLSLLILELFSRITHASLHTEFQRGHTAVSTFWGLLGLALLYVGLKRGWRSVRVAGLAFFPVSLAKIFLYDLPSLSSVTRALSFLAVGAVLLLGGFFYQRLTADKEKPPVVLP